jgi:glycerol kinase
LEELSGVGAAYMAAIAIGVYNKEEVFAHTQRAQYDPCMDEAVRRKKRSGWKNAVNMVLGKSHPR